MSKKTVAMIVNPKSSKPVESIEINGYDDIKELFGKSADPEGSTLCHLQGDAYLQVWADCQQYMVAPAWVTAFNRQMPIHGLALIDAYDISTGEAIDCPIQPEVLLQSIEWEPVGERLDPDRPNQDWIERFRSENVNADFVVQYGDE